MALSKYMESEESPDLCNLAAMSRNPRRHEVFTPWLCRNSWIAATNWRQRCVSFEQIFKCCKAYALRRFLLQGILDSDN